MNVRKIAEDMAGLTPNYFEINREERNYAAILFAALCKPDNARRFLKHCGYDDPIVGPDFGIYLEYSYLRDLWNKIHEMGNKNREKSEEIKKEIIRRNLQIKGIDAIMAWSAEEINEKFGVFGKRSKEYVQYPGNWSISKFEESTTKEKRYDNEDFLKICWFKWAFNIKPDIVIHLDKSTAICIETKLESGEGSYPASDADKKIFKDREIEYVKQMDLQEYMMKDLLGLETHLILIGLREVERENFSYVHWEEAFGWLDLGDLPCFAIEMVKRISEENK